MISDFAPHAADCGFRVSLPLVPDGRLHRVNWLPDSGKGVPGWYVAHDHGSWAAVVWGDWRSGWQETWTSKAATRLTQAERAQAKVFAEQARAAEAKERARAQSSAHRRADWMWTAATPMEVIGEGHPYLTKKRILGNGMRLGQHDDLLIPLRDSDGNVRNLQRIFPDGAKRFVRDAGVSGLWWRTGPLPAPEWTGDLVVTEGVATAATVRALSGLTVFAAMNAENLPRVTAWMRKTWAGARILIAADDDRWEKDGTARPVEKNTGRKAAAKAAEETRALVIIPVWDDLQSKGTDWNDLAGEETEPRVKDKWRGAVAIAALDRQAATMTDAEYARRRGALASAYAAAGAGRMGQRELDARRKGVKADQPDVEEKEESPASVALEMADGAELWRSQFGEAYATVDANGETKSVMVEGEEFSDWLLGLWRARFEGSVLMPPQVLAGVVRQSAAIARTESPQHNINYRMAMDEDGSRWLDLGRDDGSAVRWDAEGWKVVEKPMAKFMRGSGDIALPVPCRNPDLNGLDPLWDLINVGTRDRCLIAGWLLSAMRADAPCFGLNLHGAQGTAKSTATKILRRILDPSPGPTQPLEEDDVNALALTFLDQWIPCFENVSHLENKVQDTLCRLTTGMGMKNRKLYSDNTMVTYNIRRPWIINGINNVCTRDDLAQRSIPVELMAIPAADRLMETELEEEFIKVRPHLLAVLLDAAVAAHGALRLGQNILVRNKLNPRMIDAAAWITAGEEAMGFDTGDFAKRLKFRQEEIGRDSIENNPVVLALNYLVGQSSRGYWQGTHSQILSTVEDYLPKVGRPRDVPTTVNALAYWFNRERERLRTACKLEVSDKRRVRSSDGSREWMREVQRIEEHQNDDADFL